MDYHHHLYNHSFPALSSIVIMFMLSHFQFFLNTRLFFRLIAGLYFSRMIGNLSNIVIVKETFKRDLAHSNSNNGIQAIVSFNGHFVFEEIQGKSKFLLTD